MQVNLRKLSAQAIGVASLCMLFQCVIHRAWFEAFCCVLLFIGCVNDIEAIKALEKKGGKR